MTDLVELTRQHLNEEPEDDAEQLLLTELIALRTGAIAFGLAKTKQYANRLDSEVRNLKSDANALGRSKTPENANKKLADALQTMGNLFYLQRKMTIYDALTSAATGVGVDGAKKILLKLEKQLKGRR